MSSSFNLRARAITKCTDRFSCISCTAKFIHQGTHSPMLMHTYTRQHATIPASTHSPSYIILRLQRSRFLLYFLFFSPHSIISSQYPQSIMMSHRLPVCYRHQNTVCFSGLFSHVNVSSRGWQHLSLFLTCILLGERLAETCESG